MDNENTNIPDTGARSEFETGAVRDAMEGKGIPSLIPSWPLYLASLRFEEGAKKYGRDNWRRGIPLSRYLDGFERHKRKWLEGWEDEDHEGAMIWNILCLLQTTHMIRRGLLPMSLDDLPEAPIENQLLSIPSNWKLRDLYMTAHRDPYVETEYDRQRRREAEKVFNAQRAIRDPHCMAPQVE